MLKLESLGLLLVSFTSLTLSACSSAPGAPGTGGSPGTGSAGTSTAGTGVDCTMAQQGCGTTCASCGCAPCAAFAACAVVGDCAEGTKCTSNPPCSDSLDCPSLCLPQHPGSCDAMPCEAGQSCEDSTSDGTALCFAPAAAGAPCATHLEGTCIDGYFCDSFDQPHVCKPQTPPGKGCTSSESCTEGYYCTFSGNKCVKSVTAGKPCTSYDACAKGLYCDLADSAGMPTCLPSGDSGAPCHDAIGACKSKKHCVFPANITCTMNHDCKDNGGACCQTQSGVDCAVYSPGCMTATGVCP